MSIKNLFKKDNKNKTDDIVAKTDKTVKLSNTDKDIKKNDSSVKKVTKSVINKKQIKEVKDVKNKKTSDISYRVLLKPLVTEKGSSQAILGKYLFMVAPDANKIMIAQAVERTYGVKVLRVNVINYSGKKVTRGKISGKRKDWKKAIVTLQKGQTIEVFKGV